MKADMQTGGDRFTMQADNDQSNIPFAAEMPGPPDAVSPLEREIEALRAENARLTEAYARDGFLAVASHELINGLSPVIGRVDILRRKAANMSGDAITEELNRVAGLTAAFANRARTLLDVSRITSGMLKLDRAAINVNQTACAVVDSFRAVAEIARTDLSVDVVGNNVAVGDSLSLEQILDNLVSNAIKYGGGNPVQVRVRSDDLTNQVQLTVHDNGPGISPENQSRIFEQFERAVRPGSTTSGFGVGLWVVKQLTEAMGGEVKVSSSPNQGTTFFVALPSYRERESG